MRKIKNGEKQFIDNSSRVCLYCGEEMERRYEDYQPYWECNCADAKKERELRAEIEKIKYKMPQHNFAIEDAKVIRKIKK